MRSAYLSIMHEEFRLDLTNNPTNDVSALPTELSYETLSIVKQCLESGAIPDGTKDLCIQDFDNDNFKDLCRATELFGIPRLTQHTLRRFSVFLKRNILRLEQVFDVPPHLTNRHMDAEERWKPNRFADHRGTLTRASRSFKMGKTRRPDTDDSCDGDREPVAGEDCRLCTVDTPFSTEYVRCVGLCRSTGKRCKRVMLFQPGKKQMDRCFSHKMERVSTCEYMDTHAMCESQVCGGRSNYCLSHREKLNRFSRLCSVINIYHTSLFDTLDDFELINLFLSIAELEIFYPKLFTSSEALQMPVKSRKFVRTLIVRDDWEWGQLGEASKGRCMTITELLTGWGVRKMIFTDHESYPRFNRELVQGVPVLPHRLTQLEFVYGPHQLGQGVLPPSLTQLTLGYRFNRPLGQGVLPTGLTHLNLGGGFNQPLGGGVLPPSLTQLTLATTSTDSWVRACCRPASRS